MLEKIVTSKTVTTFQQLVPSFDQLMSTLYIHSDEEFFEGAIDTGLEDQKGMEDTEGFDLVILARHRRSTSWHSCPMAVLHQRFNHYSHRLQI